MSGRRRSAAAATVAISFLVGMTACGDSSAEPAASGEPAEPVAIVEVVDDVEYYIACANEPVDVEGVMWYPVPDWGNDVTGSLHEQIVSVERQPPDGPIGFAPRVAPPGPGDDVGTLFVYADGYAFFESDSGLSVWLTRDELAYDWVC